MQQPYVIATQLLDGMTTINRAWYTREDQVSPLTFKLTKEQMEKDQERDQNMDKIMTQLDILSKNVIGAGARSVNAVGVGCANPDESKFEPLYNEEVNFLANQGDDYRSNYQSVDQAVGDPNGSYIVSSQQGGLASDNKANPKNEVLRYLDLETKHVHYGAKRDKEAETTKKRRPEDCRSHWASRRMALVSPNVPVCKVLKDKIKAIERSSRRVAEWFREAVPYRPKLQSLKLLKDNAERC
uniref:Integrase core domain containing protein n=1 Tax=Solanum tuberosum TaxID=4113 RepID=M1DH69_SOLTU